MNAIVLPNFAVTAIAQAPSGAFPSYAHGYYARDNSFYVAWDAIARDRATFRAWIDRHVLGTHDHAQFMQSLKVAA
jgi:glutaconate CoA-transferase subunit A